nr:hypothetical protein [Armatimonadota bacterium]
NTHLNGLTREDPWNTNASQVGAQLRYLGVRLDRDWLHSAAEGKTWREVQKAWNPLGRFWTSIDEASPEYQRKTLGFAQTTYSAFPGLIYALGGPNEEDNAYPQGQGATLPDSALVQHSLYEWAHSGGRNIPVSQMEFGAGWSATNDWQGDYNPGNTGIHQNYTPGPADLGAAHTYLHQPGQRPVDALNQVRTLARLTTPGKPVAHTEFGAYKSAFLSNRVFGQFLVMGALDSMAAGDAAFIVYGLQDSGPENTYGFYSYPGSAPHEAAEYFHTLTTLLQSAHGSYGPGQPPTFTPVPLPVTFGSAAASHLVMQKPTGDYVIADWSEQAMTGGEHREADSVRFGKPFPTLRVYDVEDGTTPIAVRHKVRQYALSMKPSDTYLLVLSRT